MVNSAASMDGADLRAYLGECREITLEQIRCIIPQGRPYDRILYDLMLDYPMRDAKALRPALCIATCRALGGQLQAVQRTAAVIELYHNAFLVHDDVEDGSELRRSGATLHREHGVPIAVNVGDAMLAVTMEPLLANVRDLGLGRALRIMQVVARMARESVEGQAVELDWIAQRRWDLGDRDYVRMVHKKTSWYTFVTPVLLGAIIADARDRIPALTRWAITLGVAFQIQDDVLNLVGEVGDTGKESCGDLWEGKHTLMLVHAMREADPAERERAAGILAKPRPSLAAGDLGVGENGVKTSAEVGWLLDLMRRYGSIEYAQEMARRRAGRAARTLAACDWMADSVHRRFLEALVEFVVERRS